ncbi:MAG: DUF4157 domain-containing protein [Pseudomonadales bacterium]|nr:DUF4157 domain-containing protein [Pseudomonadales bacterium]
MESKTGLPEKLKSGMESLSGQNLDDVTVHYNSSKPAQLGALAYAQGSEIHLGSGQEKHLAHELCHVVQQKQGRVKPAFQMGGVVVQATLSGPRDAQVIRINPVTGLTIVNDADLEREAEMMVRKL